MELTWRKRLWKMGDTLFHKMTFEEAAAFNVLRLYAGDIPAKPLYENQGSSAFPSSRRTGTPSSTTSPARSR